MEVGKGTALANDLCMNEEDKEISYANNSLFQKTVILNTRRILEDTIKEYLFTLSVLPTCIKVADLGCSSGPNTFLTISEIVDVVLDICRQAELKPPEFHVFLNDLPGNDFNAIFRSVPGFLDKLKREKEDFFRHCTISGVPGSFHGRLFPSRSLHFIHSSSSVHWLSKVPDGAENNKWNIYMAKTSPPNVFKAYAKQFQRDFSLFLSMRSEEVKPGGPMILTLVGRSNPDPSTEIYGWEPLAKLLSDLVAEGLVKEADLDSFNIPYYTPYKEEVSEIVCEEGSFRLDRLEVFEVDWDDKEDISNNVDDDFVLDKYERGQKLANKTRAATEKMLASHFGDAVIDRLFERLALHQAEHLDSNDEKSVSIIVVSMTKK